MRLVSLSVLARFLVALPAPAEPPSVGSAPPRAGRFELSFVMEPPLGSRIRGETVSMIGSWQLPEARTSR